MIQKALENNGKENLPLKSLVFLKELYTENLNNMIYKKLIISLIILNYISWEYIHLTEPLSTKMLKQSK